MCKFFSLCSDGNGNPIYFDWKIRKQILDGIIKTVESPDSHTSIASYLGHKGLKEDKLNKYEYNPLTKVFTVDQINTVDDKSIIEKFVRELDFKTIVPPLNLFPIENPLEKKSSKVTRKDLELLNNWILVRDSVEASVWDSVRDSVWAYSSKFVTCDKWQYIEHAKGVNPYQPCIDLYSKGFVPSFDGENWRLHSGLKDSVVWKGTVDKLKKEIATKKGK